MNKVDQIIGYKKCEGKLPKEKQITKNRSKGGNVEQLDNGKRERENLKTFNEERKKFLERMNKSKKKNMTKREKEKPKETEKDNYKRDDKKFKEQKSYQQQGVSFQRTTFAKWFSQLSGRKLEIKISVWRRC